MIFEIKEVYAVQDFHSRYYEYALFLNGDFVSFFTVSDDGDKIFLDSFDSMVFDKTLFHEIMQYLVLRFGSFLITSKTNFFEGDVSNGVCKNYV